MPELPEVETVVRDLRPHLVGLRIRAVSTSSRRLRLPWRKAWSTALIGHKVAEVRRRGKWIVMDLDPGPSLVMHLGMTGQLLLQPAKVALALHTHLVITLPRGLQLRFRDVRRFGCATLHRDNAEVAKFFARMRLGPEPLEMDPRSWRAALAGTSRTLKSALLDQRIVAGVGNIYADESLYEAFLHPERRACDLNAGEAERLRLAIQAVLRRAIARRGSSVRDYVGGDGSRGAYQQEFRVYSQHGKPCGRCSTAVERTRLAGRSTHFCPRCQRRQRAGRRRRRRPAA